MRLLAALEDASEFEAKLIEAGGEITPELEAQIQSINLNVAEAVDGLHLTLERMEAASEFWKQKADEASKISKGLSNAVERYRTFTKRLMADAGTTDLHGAEYRYKLSELKPKVVVDDESAVMGAGFTKEKITVVVDKDRLKSAIESGEVVAGARMEKVYSLRAYPQKRKEIA